MTKRFIMDLIHSTMKHNIGLLAGVIAFFGFSSLFPVLTLLLSVASLIVPDAAVERFLQGILQSYVPVIPTGRTFAVNTIQRLTQFRSSVSIIGVIGLLWSTIGGFVTLQQTLDTIFEVKQRRPFVLQYVFGFAMMGILMALTISSSLLSLISPEFVSKLSPIDPTGWSRLVHDIGRFIFPVILFVTCYGCYRILPSRTLRNIPLLVGAAVATLGIYFSRALFVVYTHYLGQYEVMYGTMTFVMLLTFWIYIVCIILLFAAEVSVALHRLVSHE